MLVKSNVFCLFALASLVVGCLIPSFYDWSGADQSRASPTVGWTAIGLLAFALAICVTLPWLPADGELPPTSNTGKFRFNIRTILIMTTATAALVAFFRASALPLIGVSVYLVALAYAIRFGIAFRRFRGRLLSLLACMYLPFAWVISADSLWQSLEFLWLASGLPMIFPTLFIGSLSQQHPEQMTWLGTVLTSVELIWGVWLIRLDWRWAIFSHLLALLLSTLGSFVLNALIRM